jgi:PTS system mannose-specific IIA component
MIGIVVVTHGRLAEELVNAARAIVGDISRIAAVSIGWADDPSVANQAIERALGDVGSEEGGALVLTDMFGGTPTNLSLSFLSPKVEIVTGVNLPMIIKLTTLREGDLLEVARAVRNQGKDAIYVASELLETRRP